LGVCLKWRIPQTDAWQEASSIWGGDVGVAISLADKPEPKGAGAGGGMPDMGGMGGMM
jgi:chaperonin GroEL